MHLFQTVDSKPEAGLDGHGSVPVLAHVVEVQHPLVCRIARDPVIDRPSTILVDWAVIVCAISSEYMYSICPACIHTTNGDDDRLLANYLEELCAHV